MSFILDGVAFCAALTAQTFFGSTVGTITDSTVVYLVPARYRLTIEKKGFDRLSREIEVGVEASVRIDASLQVGRIEQTVVVAALRAPIGNTHDGSMTTITGEGAVRVCGKVIAGKPSGAGEIRSKSVEGGILYKLAEAEMASS